MNETLEYNVNSSGCIENLNNAEKYIWIIFSAVLFTIGIMGNALSLLVLKKMEFWRKPSTFLLVPLTITDMVVLCTGLSRNFVYYVTGDLDLATISDASCNVFLFTLYTSMQLSSWILVEITFERFLKTNVPFWYIRYVTVRKEAIFISITIITLILVNFHFFFTTKDGHISCGELDRHDFESEVYVYIDLALLSFIPALLIIFMNVAIIVVLRKSRTFIKQSAGGQNGTKIFRHHTIAVTKMLLFCSTYFILATLPVSIFFIWRSRNSSLSDIEDAKSDLSEAVIYVFQFSNYATNFLMYISVNPKFRTYMILTLRCKDKR